MSPQSSIGRVLLADDDPAILRSYSQRLRAEGYDVGAATDATGALALATQQPWDVLLLDARMPGHGIVDLIRLVRSRREIAGVPIWLLGLPGDADLIEQGTRAGAEGAIDKSRMAPRDIADKVGEILAAPRRPWRPAPPVPAAASQIPSNVEDVVRRFRGGGDPGRSVAAAPGRSAGASASSPFPPLREPERDPFEDDDTGSGSATGTSVAQHAPPPPTPVPQYSSPPRVAQSSAPAAAAPRPSAPAVVQSPASSVAITSMPANSGETFDVVLNRVVGQPGQLAQALGFRTDYSCPICSGPLVLRLRVDPTMEFAVRGHFYCPSCAQNG